ncbi:MAG: hypothetical protein GX446_00215 [Chthonomonadales bacterium]|nr:hypothetical protein [Chthonomonadales bacterium]
MKRRTWIGAAFGLLLAVNAQGVCTQQIVEDFASYPEGAVYGARWELGGLGWSIRNGRLACEAGTRTTAVPAAAPHARRLTFEAVMRPERAVGSQWKVAGIAIVADDANFWQLSLVEGPDTSGKVHSLELHQMLAGRWLANIEGSTALTRTVEEGLFAWEADRDYRLRIELQPDGIEGTVEELGSARRYRVGYAFRDPCVRSGRPTLVTSSLSASFASYRAEISETAKPPTRPRPPTYTLPPMSSMRTRATGFFRVEKIGDRWWVIDPRGHAFYVVGTDHVNYEAHWCEKLGYAPYSRNVKEKYKSEDAWAASATERLKAWGFNTLGAGHSESVRYRGLVHTVFLSLGTAFTAYGDIAPRTTWTGFPDVFDPRFAEFCKIEARKQCAPHTNDPWLLGYFLDNELEWFGKNGTETGLVDETMKKPASHPAKRAFIALLRKRYAAVGNLNRAWKSQYASWDALASATEAPTGGAAHQDRLAFVRLIAERYFSITCEAIRQADPNHMILGCRFAGFAPPIWDIAGRHLDIVSVNYYGNVDLDRGTTTDMPQAMARYYAQARRPLLITEWSFPALDAGLPSRHGAGQRVPTQRDKARAYAIYQTALFAMPFMVGSNYFMWVDEPELGISSTFPEDSNYGLVDVNDRPWPELTAMAARLNPRAVAIHAGDTSEVSAQIGAGGITIRNAGKRAAKFVAEIYVQGRRTAHALQIKAGGRSTVPLTLKGPSLVVVELDRAGALTERRLDDNRATRVVGARADASTILVVNESNDALRDVPVALAIPGTASDAPLGVRDAAGRALRSQVDRLPTGWELAFQAPTLPARTVSVFRLGSGGSLSVEQTHRNGAPFTMDGALNLAWNGTSGNLLDSVRLDDVQIGRVTMLVHQTNGQPLWIEPSRIRASSAFVGPVRTVRIIEADGGSADSSVRTQTEQGGDYAPRTRPAHRFAVRMRLDCYPGERWLDVRLLGVTNTDERPWKLESYFVYALASIGGSATDDMPGGAGDAPRWYDAKADISFGALMDTRRFTGLFWKDTPDGEGLHADVYRVVRRTLAPGANFRPNPPDPAVQVFAARGDTATADNAPMRRLRGLQRLRLMGPPPRT